MIQVILAILFLTSCGQDYNSNAFDKLKYSGSLSVGSPEEERLVAAYSVIEKNCISCHNGYHNNYSSYKSSDNWVETGLVVPGDFENSFLVKKLKNYGGTMPQGGASLGSSEIEAIQSWIENL